MIEEMTKTSEEMLLKAGFTNVGSYRTSPAPGSVVHEMGTARMGNDPKTLFKQTKSNA
jgi:choline dehydrogenase-like flavoprotein